MEIFWEKYVDERVSSNSPPAVLALSLPGGSLVKGDAIREIVDYAASLSCHFVLDKARIAHRKNSRLPRDRGCPLKETGFAPAPLLAELLQHCWARASTSRFRVPTAEMTDYPIRTHTCARDIGRGSLEKSLPWSAKKCVLQTCLSCLHTP